MTAADCPLPLAPETLNCSGRGVGCVDGQCLCEPGWIGQGDFVSGSPACHLNVVGVRIVWGTLAIFEALCFVVTIAFLYNKQFKKGISRWKDPGMHVSLLVLFTSASLSALGIVRTADPSRGIGTDPAATLLFAFGSAGFWTFCPCYVSIVLRLLEKGLKARNESERNHIKRFIYVGHRAIPIVWTASMVASLAPLFILIDPSNGSLMYNLAACHFVVLAASLFIGFLQVQVTVPPILSDIEAATAEMPDPRLSSIHWKLSKFKNGIRDQAIFQAASAGIFGLWPLAQRYASYEVGLAWLGSAVIMAIAVYSLTPSKMKQIVNASPEISSNNNNSPSPLQLLKSGSANNSTDMKSGTVVPSIRH